MPNAGSQANKFTEMLERHKQARTACHVMGVHDCVSAKVAASTGFEGVWISSLGMSIAAGKCDRNELPWTAIADLVEFIAESCDIPILIDGNEGYGDTAIARIFARRVIARGGSAICFEDKTYPKKNSFSDGVELCSIDEFCRKIAGCCDAIADLPGSILARTDSLVAGEGVAMALRRANAYADAGAAAIVVLSKASTVDQLAEFMAGWNRDCPIVSVPTGFDQTAPEVFDKLGVACVIWANQMIRASIHAMERAGQTIRAEGRVGPLAENLISVKAALALADCGLGCESL